jgi:hypothetical protein
MQRQGWEFPVVFIAGWKKVVPHSGPLTRAMRCKWKKSAACAMWDDARRKKLI